MKGKGLPEKLGIVGLCTAFIALVGASRVYLGVHYPSDVLAGYAAAFPWMTACLTAYEKFERQIPALDALTGDTQED